MPETQLNTGNVQTVGLSSGFLVSVGRNHTMFPLTYFSQKKFLSDTADTLPILASMSRFSTHFYFAYTTKFVGPLDCKRCNRQRNLSMVILNDR